jgi:predicted anti-sigma-YlaC factor YlaD
MTKDERSAMDCHQLVEAITDYLEGALPAEERAALDEHLAVCMDCRTYLEQMRQTIRLAGRLTEASIPVAGRDELLAVFRTWRARRS